MRIDLCSSIFIKHKIYLIMYTVYSCYINDNRNRIISSTAVGQSPAIWCSDTGWLPPPAFIQDTSPGWECLELVPTGFQLESAAW